MLALAVAAPSPPAPMTQDVKAINDSWAHITYEVKGSSTQTKALDKLAEQAAALVAQYPGQAEPLLWQGIVVSEQANRANIFHKLSLASKARDILAKAYAIDPKAANGGAAMSLGVLYYKVPGSPIGFGDDAKAKRLLKEALALDPDGLDANYFYGDFLLDQGDKAGAKSYLAKGAPRPARPDPPGVGRGPPARSRGPARQDRLTARRRVSLVDPHRRPARASARRCRAAFWAGRWISPTARATATGARPARSARRRAHSRRRMRHRGSARRRAGAGPIAAAAVSTPRRR